MTRKTLMNMKRRSRLAGAFCALAWAATTTSATAASIPVTNFSFEILPAGGLPISYGPNAAYSVDAIPGWTNDGVTGQFQPGTHAGNFTYFNALSDGITSAFGNVGSIQQTVGTTVEVGALYTLAVDIGMRNDNSAEGSAFLSINGNNYAAIGTFVPGGWGTFTANYLGTIADAGAPITIYLAALGAQGNFDNVRLETTGSVGGSAPEPASMLFVGGGLLALARQIKRRGGRIVPRG